MVVDTSDSGRIFVLRLTICVLGIAVFGTVAAIGKALFVDLLGIYVNDLRKQLSVQLVGYNKNYGLMKEQ